MTIDTGLWHKNATYEDVVATINKDYKVTLPKRTSLEIWDSFAMSQFKEMQAELSDRQQAGHDHQRMEAAMTDAAGEQGISRHELTTFMNHLSAQSTSAAETLQRQLNETSQAQQRAMAQQGDAFAQALAEQSQAADRRDRAQQLAMEALRQAPQTSAYIQS